MNSFTFYYDIRLDDLDYMGIVGNADWLILLERSRADLLSTIGYPMSRFFKERIAGVVADLKVKYVRPARFGDRIQVTISAAEASEVSGVLEYSVNSSEGKPFIRAETKMVFVNEQGRPIPMPQEIRNALYDHKGEMI